MACEQQKIKSKVFKNELMPDDSGKSFYLDSETADVHFSLDLDGIAIRIGANKILLAMASDVFKRMFYGELKENGDVNLNDVTESAFKEFLQYFYLKEVKLTEENIAEVLNLGHKYNVKKCVADCNQFLIDILNEENIWLALRLADLFENSDLKKVCETFIIVNTADVFQSSGFLECNKRVLGHILKLNVLSCSEIDVFEACMAWVKAKSGETTLTKELVDTHLGQLYYEIRFTSMTIEQLLLLMPKFDAMRDELINLIQMIHRPESQPEHFNKRPRQANWDGSKIIECNRALNENDDELAWVFFDRKHLTTFSTSKPVHLGELTCRQIGVGLTENGRVQELRSNLFVDLEILERKGGSLLKLNARSILKMKVELKSEGTTVSFLSPVLIKPGFRYTISMEHFPDNYCYDTPVLKCEVKPKSDLTVQFHDFNAHENEKYIGLISALKFTEI